MSTRKAPVRNRRKTARYRTAIKARRRRNQRKSAHGKRLP